MSEELFLNVADRISRTEAEGPGRRYALWVQGCPLRCPHCCNPHMLEDVEATLLSVSELSAEICSTKDIEGITLIGGEPFSQANALGLLAENVRSEGLSVMVFTGFTLAQLTRSKNEGHHRLLASTDLLVDGPFVHEKRVTDRRWIGSSNQQVHFLTERYAHLSESANGWDQGSNTIEIRLKGDQLLINGFPHPSLTELLSSGLKTRGQ